MATQREWQIDEEIAFQTRSTSVISMRASLRSLAGVVILCLLGLDLLAVTDSAPAENLRVPRPLEKAILAPALKAAADRDGISLRQSEILDHPAAAGDAIVAWIGTKRGVKSQQWLVQFKRSSSTAAERNAHRVPERKKYLAWGSIVTFKSDVEALDLWIAGPVEISPSGSSSSKDSTIANTQRTRIFVPTDYLQLGLDESARVNLHVSRKIAQILKEDPQFGFGHLYSLDEPIKPENIAWAKPVAEKIGYTPEMERAWMGGYVALEAFYDLANSVPTLRKIAEIAVAKPPLLKLAKQAFGTRFKTYLGGPGTSDLDPAAAGLLPVKQAALEAPFGFSLGNDKIVSGVMVVTTPRPPLDVSAGILALFAVHPTDPTRAVEVVLLGAN